MSTTLPVANRSLLVAPTAEKPKANVAETDVAFPDGEYKSASMTIRLGPTVGPWDRPARVVLIDEAGEEIELARLMTPYGVGGEWTVDLTHALPLLTGKKRIQVSVESMVLPTEKWTFDAKIHLESGTPAPGEKPVAAEPFVHDHRVEYGKPEQPSARSATIDVPEGTQKTTLNLLLTGLGHWNGSDSQEAGEFARKYRDSTIYVDGEPVETKAVWRDDCAEPHGVNNTRHPNPNHQYGTYKYSRNGWCPGDTVDSWEVDLGQLPAGEHEITWEPDQAYVNRRPNPGLNNPYYDVSGIVTHHE
jgi:hypothetical protein